MPSSIISQQSTGLASDTQSGLVSTTAQTFAGDKTFNGQILTPNRPTATWRTTCSLSRTVTIYRNIGNNASTYTAPGVGVTGNVVRFTAPYSGMYLINISAVSVSSAQTLLISMYGSFSSTNPLSVNQEILDLRRTGFSEEAYTISQILYLAQNDYVEPDVYRPTSTYSDNSAGLHVSITFLG
jgi:hypothetical protein